MGTLLVHFCHYSLSYDLFFSKHENRSIRRYRCCSWPNDCDLFIGEGALRFLTVKPKFFQLRQQIPGVHPPLFGQFVNTFSWHIPSLLLQLLRKVLFYRFCIMGTHFPRYNDT
jgi:hypothetical protein